LKIQQQPDGLAIDPDFRWQRSFGPLPLGLMDQGLDVKNKDDNE
jgi:hypothetical protein